MHRFHSKAINFSFFILHFSLLFACTETNEEGLTLLFTGDVLLDRGVQPVIERKGVEYLFEGVADEFHRADAVIINLECPLTDTLSPIGKQYIFQAPTCHAAALRAAGITHACMANNHTNDQGRRGIRSTAAALREADMVPLGYGTSYEERTTPVIIEKKGVTVALFNTVTFPLENWVSADTPGVLLTPRPDVCQLSAEALVPLIRTYKEAHPQHVVIAILHWGTEFQQTPSQRQRLGAAHLARAGCDAIIGHHPHVVQNYDELQIVNKDHPSAQQSEHPSSHHSLITNCSKTVPVFYSLGNFVFDQTSPSARRAVMAEITITPDTLTARSIPVSLRRCRPFTR